MQQKDPVKVRRKEVITGFVILLAAFSFMAALLLDFHFVSPYATLQEDLSYLADNPLSQQISAYAWLATALFILLAVPLYLACFHGRLKILHSVNGLLMLGAAAGFVLMGKEGLAFHQTLMEILENGIDQANEEMKLRLLEQFRKGQFYRQIGSSLVGIFSVGLGLTRVRMVRFPLVSTVLLLVSGPLLVFFNWYDQDHLIRTAAMAGILVGVAIFSVRLINRGLQPSRKPTITPKTHHNKNG